MDINTSFDCNNVLNSGISLEPKKLKMADFHLPSKMAFQVLFKLRHEGADITMDELLPYPGKHVMYQARKHFGEWASRPRLNHVVNTSYGFINFECRGEESRKRMCELIEKHEEAGWTLPNGDRYRPVYADIDGDEATLLLVSVKETCTGANGKPRKVESLRDLGIWVSSDPKAGKRVRRSFANAVRSIHGTASNRHVLKEGVVYDITLKDGTLLKMLDVDMEGMDARERAFFDGSLVINLPGFNGCIGTVDGPFGQAKGIARSIPSMTAFDIYCYGMKEEIMDLEARVFISNISYVGLGKLWTDMQTVTNIGAYDPALIVTAGLAMLNNFAKIMLDGTQDEVCDLFAPLALADEEAYKKKAGTKPRWATMQYLKGDIGFDRFGVVFERLFKAAFDNLIKIDKCRVPIEQGIRAYAAWNPLCGTASGRADFSLDELGGTVNGLPTVCVMDAPEGRLLIGRNPNTHPGEFILVWNLHRPGLKEYKGKGWCFFGANAGELLAKLNGGDMDDGLMVIWDSAIIDKWLTMEYPVQPKIKEKKETINEARADRRRRFTGVSDEWNWATFEGRKDKWKLFERTLGGFIIKLWVEMLLSAEHKATILESINNGSFLTDDFHAPSVDVLKAKCLPKDMAYLADGYDETPEGYLEVCRRFITKKEDYRAAQAASNSEHIIDLMVARKGSEETANMLFAQTDELFRTPVFPICFKDRVPAERKAAGNYILVETKLCQAMQLLEDRYNEILEEMKERKQLALLELPQVLVQAFPVDERTRQDAGMARKWWVSNMDRMRGEGRMDTRDRKRSQWYKDLADGEKIVIEHVKEVVVVDEEGRKTTRKVLESIETKRNPGLVDLYAFQFEPSEDAQSLVPTTNRRSTENRLAMAIHWLNEVYRRQSTSDGVPDFMLLDVYNAIKKLGMAGFRAFLSFNQVGRFYADQLANGERLEVNAVSGILYHPRTGEQLTDEAEERLTDGPHKVSKAGVILVRPCHPELAANRKATVRAASVKGRFIE